MSATGKVFSFAALSRKVYVTEMFKLFVLLPKETCMCFRNCGYNLLFQGISSLVME